MSNVAVRDGSINRIDLRKGNIVISLSGNENHGNVKLHMASLIGKTGGSLKVGDSVKVSIVDGEAISGKYIREKR